MGRTRWLGGLAVVAGAVWLAACSSSKGAADGAVAAADAGGGGTVIIGGSGGGSGGADVPVAADAGGSGDGIPGLHHGPPCTTDADCTDSSRPFCTSGGTCVACVLDTHCGEGKQCVDGKCVGQGALCVPDEPFCQGTVLKICDSTGHSVKDSLDCAPGQCIDGACTGCAPGQRQCLLGNVVECRPDGSGFDQVEACDPKHPCTNGACAACFPGVGKCEGNDAFKCKADGSGWEALGTCPAGTSCVAGSCVSQCSGDIKFNTNVGCDYWAVDLDNAEDPSLPKPTYAIVVSNTTNQPAEVTIRSQDGGAPQASATVPPGELHVFELPPRDADGAVDKPLAWRLQSTAPIVAYQFNPLNNEGVFSNDASVLFPSNAWGTEYYAMSWPQLGSAPDGFRSFVTIVAGYAETHVTVTPTAPTLGGNGVPALQAGESHEFVLQPYEVLNLESNGPEGSDLTGTHVVSDKRVGVFAGHECAYSSTVCCCDHLEEQMIPVDAWGKTYVAPRSKPRGVESDYWRIVAAEDGTTVTLNPSITIVPMLDAGEHFDFKSTTSFVALANKPILVAKVLASSFETDGTCDTGCQNGAQCLPADAGFLCELPVTCSTPGPAECPWGHNCVNIDPTFGGGSCEPIGDPAMVLMVPQEQFRDDYLFLVPSDYVYDFLDVVAPDGTSIALDAGAPIALQPIPGTGFSVATVEVSDGVHRIKSTDGTAFGIFLYGYDDDVSYAYPGGMGKAASNK